MREQPFQVKVMPEVSFICDLHAHLADAEVIGFLGGRWDRDSSTLYIQVEEILVQLSDCRLPFHAGHLRPVIGMV